MTKQVFLLLVMVVVLASGGCSTTNSDESSGAAAVRTTLVVPTSGAATSTTQTVTSPQATTTMADPEGWPASKHWHSGEYQSAGYSCGEDPVAGCKGDAKATLSGVWISQEEWPEYLPGSTDFIDFFMGNADKDRTGDMPVGYADDIPAGSGHGVRIVPLDAPPEGLEVAGNAWLELTISSVSASDFAALSPQVPQPSADSSLNLAKFHAPSHLNPIAVRAPARVTDLIEEAVLAETTDDMMKWIIGLRDPGACLYWAAYWGTGDPSLETSAAVTVAFHRWSDQPAPGPLERQASAGFA